MGCNSWVMEFGRMGVRTKMGRGDGRREVKGLLRESIRDSMNKE